MLCITKKENHSLIVMQIYTSDICVCIYMCTYDESCALNIAIGKLLLPEIVKILDEHLGHVYLNLMSKVFLTFLICSWYLLRGVLSALPNNSERQRFIWADSGKEEKFQFLLEEKPWHLAQMRIYIKNYYKYCEESDAQPLPTTVYLPEGIKRSFLHYL